jgi:HK97 family phage portal protein
MGIISRIKNAFSTRSVSVKEIFGEEPDKNNVTVNADTVIAVPAVLRAVTVISDSIGTMPIKMYRKVKDGRENVDDDPVAVLFEEANPEQSADEFFSQLQWYAELYGTGYAEIERNGLGEPIALWSIPTHQVTPKRDDIGNVVYEVRTPEAAAVIDATNMLVFKGRIGDALEGLNPVKLARQSFEYTLSLEAFGNNYFKNNCLFGGVLEAPHMSDNARDNLINSFRNANSGTKNVGKWIMLEEGAKANRNTINNESAQYLENRNAQILEVCRVYGVDPLFLYDYSKATWNNAEHQVRNFLQFTLNPKLKRNEAELKRKLMPEGMKKDYYFEYLRESIVQLDAKTQDELYALGLDKGWYRLEEVRKWKNLPPLPKELPNVVDEKLPEDQLNNDDGNTEPKN